MDAIKFIEERNRMCNEYSGPIKCDGCPLQTKRCSLLGELDETTVKIIEEWSATHPRKARQDIFLEQWPNARLDAQGTITICPKHLCKGKDLSRLMAICVRTDCCDCRRMFWKGMMENE